jgi:UDP-N-acetylglucosamine 2-epimerase (non-hydrolysing)
VGTQETAVREAILELATDRSRYDAMARAVSPYGDGRAAQRTVAAIRRFAGLPERPDDPPPL